MNTINWTHRFAERSDDDLPTIPAVDPELGVTKERPAVTRDMLERDVMSDSGEHKVLRNIARTYARYYGPKLD